MLPSLQRLTKSKFARNVAVVATGTAGAQAITMAFAPIITRLYGPEAFGLLGSFTAIAAVVMPLAALSYPVAIVLPKKDEEALAIIRLSAFIAMVIAAISGVLLWWQGEWLASRLRIEAIGGFLMLIPVLVLFSAWAQAAKQWLIRKQQFSITARVAVLNAFLLNSCKAGVGWFHPVAAVLISAATLGHALNAALLTFGARRHQAKETPVEPAKPDKTRLSLIAVARKYYDFPLYRAPQISINAASQSLPVLLLAAFFGPAAAGFYTLGKVVLAVPSSLLGASVAEVFYPKINQAALAGGNTSSLIFKATVGLAVLGLVPYGLVITFGPWLFTLVFGTDWAAAGQYAQWLSLWLFFAFINRPSVAAIPVLKLQGYFLIYEVASIALRAFALFLGFYFFKDDLVAVALFSISGVVLNVALILITLITSKKIQPTTEPQ